MTTLQNNKRPYEAPQLTVVSFKVEQGFAGSGVLSSLMFWENSEQDNMENYETQDNWHSGGQFWD